MCHSWMEWRRRGEGGGAGCTGLVINMTNSVPVALVYLNRKYNRSCIQSIDPVFRSQ